MLAQFTRMIEPGGLQIGGRSRNFGQGGLRQDLSGDIVDRAVGDLVNEADVAVFAGGDARDYFTARDFGIDNCLATAAAVVDHHDEILHERYFLYRRKVSCKKCLLFRKIRNRSSDKFGKTEIAD
jgi:hypothetical protein